MTFRTAIQANGKAVIFYQSAMLTCVMSVAYILNCMKDSLLVHHIGPEAVVFARSYLVPPAIFVFFIFYAKLLNLTNQSKAFNYIVASLVLYYILFSFYLYPNLASLTSYRPIRIDHWTESAQAGAQLLFQWPLTFHYLVSELWVIFVLGVMTWQLFNAINTKETAGEVYYLLQLVANGAIILAGALIYQSGKSTENQWELNLKIQTLIISLLALGAIFLKNKLMETAGSLHTKETFETLKLSLKDSLKLIVSSKKLRLLFLMMFAYGMCNSFLETTNRHYLKKLSSSIQEYNSFAAIQAILIGSFTIGFIFLGAYFSSRKKYRLSMRITPFLLMVCSLLGLIPGAWSLWPLLFLSMSQLVLVKSSKYGLIDPVKEMSYISLDKELKNKGKAAVDGLSNRFGKTGGNFLQQMIFIAAGSLSASIDLFALFVLLLALLWFNSAKHLET